MCYVPARVDAEVPAGPDPQRLQRTIVGNTDVLSPYFDVPALLRVYQRAARRPTEEDALIVWKAATLAGWLTQISAPHS